MASKLGFLFANVSIIQLMKERELFQSIWPIRTEFLLNKMGIQEVTKKLCIIFIVWVMMASHLLNLGIICRENHE